MPGAKRHRNQHQRIICPLCGLMTSLTADDRVIKHGHRWTTKRISSIVCMSGRGFGVGRTNDRVKYEMKRPPCRATGMQFDYAKIIRNNRKTN